MRIVFVGSVKICVHWFAVLVIGIKTHQSFPGFQVRNSRLRALSSRIEFIVVCGIALVNANHLGCSFSFAISFINDRFPKDVRGVVLDQAVVVAAHSKSDLEIVSIQVHGVLGSAILFKVCDLVDVRRGV